MTKNDTDGKIGTVRYCIFYYHEGDLMRILICDDEKEYLEILTTHVRQYMDSRYIVCDIAATTDPVGVSNSNQVFDLAFLDIQMDGIDGITLAKELRTRNSKLALFFITNYDEYQDDAMDLQAFRFFEKPFDEKRLYSGLDKAMEYIDGAYVDVFLYGNGTHQRVLVDDIMYVTRNNRKVVMVTPSEEYITKETFDEWCDQLPQLFFYPVHKSFLINLHYVERYAYSEIYLTNGARVPIAPRKQVLFHKFWFEYLRRR